MKRNDGYDKFRDEAGNPAFDGYAALRPEEAAGRVEATSIEPIIAWMVEQGWIDAGSEYYTADLIAALNDNATPRPEASDAPDIEKRMRKRTVAAADALAALRAELAAVKRERDDAIAIGHASLDDVRTYRTRAEAADAEVARLKDENKELVAGLEPFARVVALAVTAASHYDVDHASEVPDSQPYGALGIQWGDLRRARSLTAAKGG